MAIVGVTPEGFHGMYSSTTMDGYVPLVNLQWHSRKTDWIFTDRAATYLTAVGRLEIAPLEQRDGQRAEVAIAHDAPGGLNLLGAERVRAERGDRHAGVSPFERRAAGERGSIDAWRITQRVE